MKKTKQDIPFKSRMIARDGREVIPDPLEALNTLIHPTQRRWSGLTNLIHLLPTQRKIRLRIPTPQKQNIPKPHLCPLLLQDLLNPLQLDPIRAETLKILHLLAPGALALLRGAPALEINQNAAPHDPLVLEILDAEEVLALPINIFMDVVHAHVVVEARCLLVREMAEAVPLRRGLRVEGPDVVVDEAGAFLVDGFVEGLPLEEGFVFLEVEGQVEGDAGPGADLAGCCIFDYLICLSVQEAELVFVAIHSPGVEFRVGDRFVAGEGGEGDGWAVGHGEWVVG